MRRAQISIAIGLGDHIMVRGYLDTIKNQFSEIRISHHNPILSTYRNNDQKYKEFMTGLGRLLFSDKPYIFEFVQHKHRSQPEILKEFSIIPQKPNLAHLLCKGKSLDLGKPYIVLTTKVRMLNKKTLYPLFIDFWKILNELSEKYTIVIVGEREVERSREYSDPTNMLEVFSLYEQSICNLPKDKIIDMTLPALGITSPTLENVQQDCLIMKEAEFVITIGVGGNFCMSAAVGKTIGFRTDIEYNVDCISKHPDVFTTREWSKFINKLREHK